jgi:hypothetical protein
MRWYGVGLDLGKLNFVLRFSIIIFTLAPPSNKKSSTIFFPTYAWVIAIQLSTSIDVMSTSKCISTIMATLGFGIILIIILGFSSFRFCHIYLLNFGVISSN